MTTRQIIIVTCAYLVALVVVVYFTRATSRRVVGALAGGAAVGCLGMGAIVLGNAGVVARADLLDTVLPGAVLPRTRHLGYANLSRHLAGGPPVRVAWAWRCALWSWRSSAHRGITCTPRSIRRGWFSHRALHPSSQTPRPMLVSWPWDTP